MSSFEMSRDELGRLVREAWVRWAQTQSNAKPSWLTPYDELSEPDKEADRQIGEAIARASGAKLRALFSKLVIAVSHIEGISDERDSVPLLLNVREIVNAAFADKPTKLSVTGRERQRLLALLLRRPDGMTRKQLAEFMWIDDPNGGPDNDLAICQLVHQARLQLIPQGYTIVSNRGPGACYRLVRI